MPPFIITFKASMDEVATPSSQAITRSGRKHELPTLLSRKRQSGTLDGFVIKQPRVPPTSNVESPETQSSENVPSHSDESTLTNIKQLATNTATDNSSIDSSLEQQPSHVHENDIGNFYKVVSTLSDGQKYDNLCNVWKPPKSYPFPKNSVGRKFQYKWLNAFPWLVYSKLLNGAFCIYCVLFGGESNHNSSKLMCLYKTPFDKWQDAIRRFNHHAEKSQIHATATERALNFRSCMENRTTSLNIQYDVLTTRQVETNREKLKPIVEAVMLCGRQSIPLRGHRDDSKSYDSSKNNPGNLQAMLHCRSHLLNLCVASACSIPLVRNMMSHVKSVSDFFNMHPKRFALLTLKIKEIKPSSRPGAAPQDGLGWTCPPHFF